MQVGLPEIRAGVSAKARQKLVVMEEGLIALHGSSGD